MMKEPGLQLTLREVQWLVLSLVLVASWSTASAAPRTWTDASGNFEIQAEFVGLVDGNVQLKKIDGQQISVPLTALSTNDQTHIQSQLSDPNNSFRTWSDATGKFQVYAEFVQVSDGNVHLKRKSDSKVIIVPLSTLSSADQAHVQHQIADAPAPARINFKIHVKPILEENCIRCHEGEQQKGGLRLDSRGSTMGGGDSGTVMVPGNAAKSLIYQLVILDEDHLYRMPPKGPLLTKRQQAILKDWIDAGADWPGQLQLRDPNQQQSASKVVDSSYRGQLLADPALVKKHSRQIDTLMNIWFSREGQSKNPPVSDEVFLRRAYLDIAGRIPSLPEYEYFMDSPQPDKRDRLIRKLLDSPAYVSHTLNLWLNALRVKPSHSEFNSETYRVWLRNAIQDNMLYDEFVREQLAAQGHLHNPETAAAGYFIRDSSMPEDRVSATMQLFLGINMEQAQHHSQPSGKWTQMDFYKLYAFFYGTVVGSGEVHEVPQAMTLAGVIKEGDKYFTRDGKTLDPFQIQYHYKPLREGVFVGGYGVAPLPASYKGDDGKPHQLVKAGVPFRPSVSIDYEKVEPFPEFAMSRKVRALLTQEKGMQDINSREDFARWATSPDNHMFNKTIVNRLWERVFGVPLVGDLTNLSERGMGPNPRMTAYLIQFIKKIQYDQTLFLETLFKTETYQRVAFSIPELGEIPMGAPVMKRMSSEQILDSIVTLRNEDPDKNVTKGSMTLDSLLYVEMTKREGIEQFHFVADSRPLVEKADSTLVQELIPERNPGWDRRASLFPSHDSVSNFLGVFGQADQEIVNDSVQEATIRQALNLMKREKVDDSVDARQGRQVKHSLTSDLARRLQASGKLDEQTIVWAYNAILTRQPSAKEQEMATQHLEASPEPMNDLVWFLVNTSEFKLKP